MLDSLSSSGGIYLVVPLLGTFTVASLFLLLRKRRRKTKLKTVLRVLLNPRVWLHKSAWLDYQYVFAAALVFSVGLAYITLATGAVSEFVYLLLGHMFGTPAEMHTGVIAGCIAGVVLYLSYELAYWFDHYISHKLPFLWEFHKVHHSAEVLTPFTNWRVHPVDTAVFVNIIALVMGVVQGGIYYVMGKEAYLFSSSVTNFIIMFYMTVYGHLQHSLLWINFTGLAGKVFMSPAHHQIHHSTNPLHYDRNFGAGLSLFDWIFGTHFQPPKENARLTLGAGDSPHLKKLVPSVAYPFYYSWKHIRKMAENKQKQKATVA